MNLSEQEDQEYCTSCGKPATERLATQFDSVPLCEGCAHRLLSGKAISFAASISEEEEPLPPEQRFEEIFKAARVLLREGVIEEAQIIPTLALANEIAQGDLVLITAKKQLVAAWEGSSEAWEAEVDRFVRERPNFRPVRVVDGILILEWLPVSVDIRNYPGAGVQVPREVMITVHPRPRVALPEQVAALYEKTRMPVFSTRSPVKDL